MMANDAQRPGQTPPFPGATHEPLDDVRRSPRTDRQGWRGTLAPDSRMGPQL